MMPVSACTPASGSPMPESAPPSSPVDHGPPSRPSEGTTAKSFADVLDSVLSDNWRLTRFVLLCVLTTTGIVGVVVGTMELLGITFRSAEEFEVDKGDARFIARSKSRTGEEYVVLVSAQGWQDSGVHVGTQDRVIVTARGSVHVDFTGLAAAVNKRQELEHRTEKQHHINRQSMDPTQKPEHYFTPDDWQALRPSRVWVGPNGDTSKLFTSYEARVADRILKDAPSGALVSAIIPLNEQNQQNRWREHAFFVGENIRGEEFVPKIDGDLWFIVNDTWNVTNPEFPDLFYLDNLGQFLVKVRIAHR